MNDLVLSPPKLGFVVVTRAMLAGGIGLLVASRIPAARRRTLARVLIGLGILTTIPAVLLVFGNQMRANSDPGQGAPSIGD